MPLKAIARQLPEEIWAVFEPILPPVVWRGIGRKPKDNRQCLHALVYVLVTGIPWEMLPPSFPSGKTVQRRLKRWLEIDAFHTAWRQLAEHDKRLQGVHWDRILGQGSRPPPKQSKKRAKDRHLPPQGEGPEPSP